MLIVLGVAVFMVGWLPDTCTLGTPLTALVTTVIHVCARPGPPIIVAPLWLAAAALLILGAAHYPRAKTK